jgi:predicted nucleic acid-binding protein
MSDEFVDTNVFIYAHDNGASKKQDQALALVDRLFRNKNGALSTQVLVEFYAAATKKLALESIKAEQAINDLAGWEIHRPDHADIVRACGLHRHYKVSWWDAMILNSAIETGCSVLWSEDLNDGQRYGTVTVRNPFK